MSDYSPVTLGERLQKALDDADQIPARLAEACNVSPASVSDWLSGTTKSLRGANLLAAAKFLGVDAEWLATGRGRSVSEPPPPSYGAPDLNERYVFVNKVRGPIIQSGPGGISWEHEEVDHSHAFNREWVAREGLDIKRCRIFKNHGNSNFPWIMDGDAVMVQLGDTVIRESDDPTENVFAVQYGEYSKFKRVVPQHDGSVLLRSYNPDRATYPDERVAGDELDSLLILGRVVWRGG